MKKQNLDKSSAAYYVALLIKKERKRLGISVSELSRRASLAKSTLSQLEAGTGNPSVETLWSIANALNVPVSNLIDPPKDGVVVVRADEGETTYANNADYGAVLLANCPRNMKRDIYRITVQPGTPHISKAHPSGTKEHLILISGKATLGPINETKEIQIGDYITYPADIEHTFEAILPDTTAVLIIEQPE